MRVAVLAGGRSLERAVSQRSGARVELALTRLGHEPVPLDADARPRRGAWPRAASTARSWPCTAAAARTARCRSCSSSPACRTPARGPTRARGRPTRSPPSACCRPPGCRRRRSRAVSSAAVRDLGADALLGRAWPSASACRSWSSPRAAARSLGLRRVEPTPEALPRRAAVRAGLRRPRALRALGRGPRGDRHRAARRGAAAGRGDPAGDDHGYDFEARYTPGATEFAVPAEVGPEPAEIARGGLPGARLRRLRARRPAACPDGRAALDPGGQRRARA